MLTTERTNNTRKSSSAKKCFFGNAPSFAFFGAPPIVIQRQQAAKLPEFSVSNFEKDYAFFHAKYQVAGPLPKTGTLFISHGVHMNYPATMTKAERTTFEADFVKSIHNIWSNKHQLMLNEPGFSSYQCNVDVSSHIEANSNDAHTVINVKKPKDLTAPRPQSNVSAPSKRKNSKTTHTSNLDFRDPTIDKDTTTSDPDFVREVGSFDLDSDKINADCKEDIEAIVAFINAIPMQTNGQCRYTLILTGRASSEGREAHNKKLSEKRLDAVANALNGLSGMCITWNDVAGEAGAIRDLNIEESQSA
jgi:outer membrane protein OmpA-like peptidoglycan-associated protein